MIKTKEQALQTALSVVPELNNKIIYKVTEDGSGEWHIIYSAQDKHCAVPSSSTRTITLSKETGELKLIR